MPDARPSRPTRPAADAPPRTIRLDAPRPAGGASFSSLPLRWAIASFAGLAIAALLPHALSESHAGHLLPAALQPSGSRTMLGLFAGWCTVAALAPWRGVGTQRELQEAIERLIGAVEEAARTDPDHRRPLPRMPERSVDRLREAIEHAIGVAAAARRHARYLEKSIPKAIEEESAKVERRFREELRTDPLTGVGNRRRLEEAIATIFDDSKPRREDRIAAIGIDLDFFKQVNDRLGHDAGDAVLEHLGRALRTSVRDADVPVRTGGDEFIVLLPGVDAATALRIAERIRSEFATLPWPHRGATRPSLSIGIAITTATGPQAADDLLRAADEATYEAKRGGRDGVRVHGASSPPPAAGTAD